MQKWTQAVLRETVRERRTMRMMPASAMNENVSATIKKV
jgi:hypothetical protein